MNQKGEATLFCVLGLVCLVSIFLLCHLSLRKTFRLMQTRTDIFLCAKETKGELKNYLSFMGRTNWAIKNLNRLSLVTLLIPGLQGVASNSHRAKRYLIQLQELNLISYLKIMTALKQKGCPLDPRLATTPFIRTPLTYSRDKEGVARLKENQWTYVLLKSPYVLELTVNANGYLRYRPEILITGKESGVKSLFPLSSRSSWLGSL